MWFQKLKQKMPNGLLEDPRTNEERAKDYKAEECNMNIAFSSSPHLPTYEEWLKSDSSNWMKLISVHNQNGSGSCVANACAMLAAIHNAQEERVFLKMSARWIYPHRMNRPGEGMYFNDAAQILVDHGSIPQLLVPSDDLTEEQMQIVPEARFESFKTIAKIFAPKNYYWLDFKIDDFAKISMEGKPILMGLRFNDGEWNKDVPTTITKDTKYCHAICVLPNSAFRYNGKKALMIVDSWGINNGMKGFRIITEDWFEKNRVMAGIYFDNPKNPTIENDYGKGWKFDNDLGWGSFHDDVEKLQLVLKHRYGIFKVDVTGKYYGYTQECVRQLQLLFGIDPTGYFGPLTRKALNSVLCQK